MSNTFFSAQGGGGTPVVPVPKFTQISFHNAGDRTFVVNGCLVDGQPCVIGGHSTTTLKGGSFVLDALPEGVNSIRLQGVLHAQVNNTVDDHDIDLTLTEDNLTLISGLTQAYVLYCDFTTVNIN